MSPWACARENTKVSQNDTGILNLLKAFCFVLFSALICWKREELRFPPWHCYFFWGGKECLPSWCLVIVLSWQTPSGEEQIFSGGQPRVVEKPFTPTPPPNPLDNLWTTDQGHQWWPSEGNTGLLNSRRKRGVGEWAAVSPTVLCPADTAKVPYPFCSHSSPLPKVSLNTWQTLKGGKDSLRPNLERS